MAEAVSSTDFPDRSGGHLRPGHFYGQVIGRRRQHGLFLSELLHPGARRLPEHFHELAYFCVLLDGSYEESAGSRTITYRPATVVFHPPGFQHLDQIGRHGGRFFSIEVSEDWLERLCEYGGEPRTLEEIRGGDLLWLALRLYREYREPGLATALAIEDLLLQMLAETAKRKPALESRRPAWLSRVTEYLDARGLERFTVPEVAAVAGVHPVHLSRVFRRFFGRTFGDHIARERARFACRRLIGTDAPLADIAAECGFADQSHFTRVFRRMTGSTPAAFRRMIRADSAIRRRAPR